jgi:ligand-binding sensor domain-containing protein/serine phosphatase RsbU (regulator of sigma subunit)
VPFVSYKNKGLQIILAVIFLFLPGLCRAQKIQTDRYDIRSGLPSNVINDILQDRKGYLWFATQVGLSRYDGYKFSNYGIEEGLPGIETECLFEDSKGRIWTGTISSGTAVFDKGVWKSYRKEEGLIDNSVRRVFEDHFGTIWCITGNGITGIMEHKLVSYNYTTGIPGRIITSFCLDDAGNIFLGTENGIGMIHKDQDGDTYKTESLMPGITVLDVACDSLNHLWIATQGSGVIRYNGEIQAHFTTKQGLASDTVTKLLVEKNQVWVGFYENGLGFFKEGVFHQIDDQQLSRITVRKLAADSKHQVWIISHDDGVFILRDLVSRRLTTQSGLADNQIWAFLEDTDGSIWLGSMSGITKFGKKLFEIFDSESGLPDKDILSVFAGNAGEVWGGTYNGPFTIIPAGKVVSYANASGLPADKPTVLKITADHAGRIWLGTYYGVTLFTQGHFINYYNHDWEREGVNTNNIIDIAVCPDNSLILATSEGICHFSGGRYTYPEKYRELTGKDIRVIAADKTGDLWIGTAEGVFILGETTKKIDATLGLSNNSCNDIFIDSSGVAWVATDNGLNRIFRQTDQSLTIKSMTRSDGLLSNSIMFAEGDRAGNIWIGHENGLSRINRHTSSVMHTYGEADGFTSLETYQKAASADEFNNIWIGTVNGIFRYNPEMDRPSLNPPRTYITGISFYNDSSRIDAYASGIDSSDMMPVNLVLPFNKNNLIFKYVGLHFANTEKNRYQYKLEGYDEKWSEIMASTQTHPYQKLPAGDYTFLVKAANCDAIWSEPVTFSFRIKPPFWKTRWFYLLELILILSAIYAFVKIRERKLQHDRRVLTEKVKERTIEIAKQRDQISEINRSLTDSIMYAQRIQSAVLPDLAIVEQLLGDYFILFKPRDIVSGDFYWISTREDRIIIVVADCTGHGVPGAFMSMLGVSLLNEVVSSLSHFTAADILNTLRDNLKRTLSQTGKSTEAKDGMDLALCILEAGKRKAQYAGAYNPLLRITDGETVILKPDKMPIGIHLSDDAPFTNQEFELKPGDVMYMFSDGYADQFGGPEQKKFKSVALYNLLQEIHHRPMSEQKQILDNTHQNWKGDQPQIDDILVMGIRIS